MYGTWQTSSVGATVAGAQTGLTFVAIGGFGSSDFVAAGISSQIGTTGSTQFSPWWELAPNSAVSVNLTPTASISTGDHISATARLSSELTNGTQFWSFVINDSTTSSTWSGMEPCYPAMCTKSSFDSAEWIEGAPTRGGFSTEIPAFPQFPITAELLQNGSTSWVGPGSGDQLVLQNLSITSGDLVYTVGLFNVGYGGSQFWVGYLFDTIPPVYGETCCSLSGSPVAPGQLLEATIDLWTYDTFNGTGPTRLALELEVWNGSVSCYDPINASVGFLGLGGAGPYQSKWSPCRHLPSGQYSVQYFLYYTPAGVEPGASGSFLLATSGASVFSKVTVVDFTPEAPTVTVPPGELDDGMSFDLSDTVTVYGTLSSEFSFSFPGAPTSCAGSFASAGPSITVMCTATAPGPLSIRATATVLGVTEESSTGLAISVNSPIAVNVTSSATRVEYNSTVQFSATASGGDGAYAYSWSGLPVGCDAGSTPLVLCTPLLFGNYTVSVNVSDGSGGAGIAASTPVEVALPIAMLLFMNYSTAPIGTPLQFLGGVAGGFAPYTFSWKGLPTGCNSVNASRLNCTATASGTFFVTLHVTDSLGFNASSNTIEFNSSGGAASAGIFGLSVLGAVVVFGGLAAVILLAVMIVARRRRPNADRGSTIHAARARPPPPP